jgi:hypothetical protein
MTGRVFREVWRMILRRCKGRTYHEIDGTINDLGDLRHVARRRTEDLQTRNSEPRVRPRGYLSLCGKVGKPEGGRMTHVVAVIGIAHPGELISTMHLKVAV